MVTASSLVIRLFFEHDIAWTISITGRVHVKVKNNSVIAYAVKVSTENQQEQAMLAFIIKSYNSF